MNKFYIQKTVHLFICVASIFSVNYASHAAPKIDPRAQQLLKHSLDTYRSLQSFQNTVVKSSTSPAGKEVTRQVISWKAPRYLNVVTISGRERLIDNYDGTHYNYTHFDTTGKFWSNEPLPDTSYGRKVLLQYQPTGMLFTPFLAGTHPFERPFGVPMSTVQLGHSSTLGGAKVHTIIATPQDDPNTQFTYLIGQRDKLIRRISVKSVVESGTYQITETHSNIKTNLTFAPGTFTFHAPPNVPLKHPRAAAMEETLNPGDTPPVINAKDINGGSASLAQYKGKVLLVDFWASWCVPCLRAMPHLKFLHQKYQNQGFEILGISSDIQLSDLTEYIKDESIPWQQVFDPEGIAAGPYNVMYIPYSVLIGRDGKVIAVNKDKFLLDAAIREALKDNSTNLVP